MDAASSSASGSRNLRKKTRKVYRDDDLGDDEIDGMQLFDLDEKINREMPAEKFYIEMSGSDVTLKYFQKNGFTTPILIRDKSGLGLRMPSQNFTVNDVKRCVGSSRVLDVMDVSTQKDLEMSLKEWVKYYENPDRQRLLNVISLEFSHTKLENYVDQPEVVHQMDWIDLVWPWHLKEFYADPVTGHGKMLYPKVQKYCLMSVGGCYTDFHIDMGGTSVWYHILRGKKIFWLIPPTEENLVAYENWTLSGRQGDVFFGDIVSKCYRITLEAGFTFFIPTGWIHAVYTPEDSLVFGGNFLHCFNIRLQLRVWEVEVKTRVPAKFRYPLFAEIHWYLLERYVSCLLGRTHRARNMEEQSAENGGAEDNTDSQQQSAFEAALKDRLIEERSCSSMDDRSATNGTSDMKISTCNGAITDSMNGSETSSSRRQNIFDMISDILIPSTSQKIVPPNQNSAVTVDNTELSSSDYNNEPALQQITINNTKPAVNAGISIATVQQGVNSSSNIANVKQDFMIRDHLQARGSSDKSNQMKERLGDKVNHRNMARYEVEGLMEVVDWLENLPPQRKNVPKDIPNPDLLLADTRLLIEYHRGDDPDLAVTGRSIIKLSASKPEKQKKKSSAPSGSLQPKQPKAARAAQRIDSTGAAWKYRRVRCKQCEPCTREDCRECYFCRDMIKYGGAGKVKQTCISRQCLGTVLPATAVCDICQAARCSEMTVTRGQRWTPLTLHPTYDEIYDGEMMECRICFEVVHPACQRVECMEVEGRDLTHSGIVDEDLPSSWECARCCSDGKEGQGKHRPGKPTYNPRPHRRSTVEQSDDSSDDETNSVVDKPMIVGRSVNGAMWDDASSRTRTRSDDDEECQTNSSKLMKLTPALELEHMNPTFIPTAAAAVYSHHSYPQSAEQLHQQQPNKLQQLLYARPWATPTAAALRPPAAAEVAQTRVNSRGREISTPRRYLL